jgi:putative transposase
MADRPNRRSIRMRGYDYASEGAYFVTICTDEMRHLFGRIANGVMATNALGNIAQQCWDAIPQHMPHVDIGEFVVMPNHVHGIVVIRERLVAPAGNTLVGGAAGADHDRPAMPPTTDNEPRTPPGQDTTEPPEMPTGNGPLDDPERPLAMGDGSNDGHVDNVPDAPDAQRRADHDRPLRPPADPGTRRPMPTVPVGSLGRIVRAYKSAVSRIAYRDGILPRGTPVWQRNYWDDIIWDHASYDRIARYIRNNPANWRKDDFHG